MIPFVWQLKKDKLTNYIVSTNDSKFDDVKTIIGDDYQDGKPYLITNNPVSDNNYIQNGARHTVLGMEYENQSYGQQTSFSLEGIRYRSKFAGVWKDWQCLTQNITTGIEFETGRIIDGKKEYGKRINCGVLLASGAKTVETGLSNVTYTDIEGICVTSGGGWPYKMGVTGSSTVAVLSIVNHKIKIMCNGDLSTYTGYVELKYFKN